MARGCVIRVEGQELENLCFVLAFSVSGVSDFGFRISGFGFRVSGFEFRVSGFGFRVSGSGFLGFKV